MKHDIDPSALLKFEPGFQALKAHIIAVTGLAYYADKDEALAERILRRIIHCQVSDCTAYLVLLSKSDTKSITELDALTGELTIGETYFFRYQEQFEELRTRILPECLERNKYRRCLRIWSAGCATGAEPYSVAILVRELLGDRLENWTVTLLATDINRDFLSIAQQARYTNWVLRVLSDKQINTYFVAEGNYWRLRDEFHKMVRFSYHNLVTLLSGGEIPNGMEEFDIILCRNVLIYFERATIQAILPHLAEKLVTDGWLLVGHSEPNEDFSRIFQTVNAPGTTLYRKTIPEQVLSFNLSNESVLPFSRTIIPLPSSPISYFQGVTDSKIKQQNFSRPTNVIEKERTTEERRETNISLVIDAANRGVWDEARRICDRLLKTEFRNPIVYFYSSLIDYHLFHFDRAEQSCRKAIYLDRTFAMAHFQLGTVLNERGDDIGTRKAFDNTLRVLRALPDNAVLPEGDGLTVAGLRNLVQLHIKGRLPL